MSSVLVSAGFDSFMLTLALTLARITPALLFLPLLGEKPMGNGILRATVLALVALGLQPAVSVPGLDVSALILPATLFKEALMGLVLGVLFAAPYFAAMSFGEIIDNQRGATLAKSIDPGTDLEASALAAFLGYFWAVLFFVSGGLTRLMGMLAESYRRFPLDATLTLGMKTVSTMSSLLSHALMAGVVAAAPVMAVLLITDLLIGVLSRFASQLNPFSLSLTVKSMVAGAVLFLYLGPGTFGSITRLYDYWPLTRVLGGVS